MKTYYHFTSRWVLPRILREGILTGDVPISTGNAVKFEDIKGFSAPWLTSDPSWDGQTVWVRGSVVCKCEVRLSVKVGDGDPNFMSWAQVCKDYAVDPEWKKALGGPAEGHEWYIVKGGIRPDRIVNVEVREGLFPLDSMSLPESFMLLENRNSPSKPGVSRLREISRAHWIKDTRNWVRSPNMQYPWSDMPTSLLHVLASTEPEKASESGRAYCEDNGVNLIFAEKDLLYPAMTTMEGVSRWLHSSRQIISVSAASAKLLDAWEPRFASLPYVMERPWRHGIMFRAPLFAPAEGAPEPPKCLIYAEPLVGEDAGVRYAIWVQQVNQTWGTVVTKGQANQDSLQCDTYTKFDHLLQAKNSIALSEDGTRLDLSKLRRLMINLLAVLAEDPKVIPRGKRKAPRARGKAGPVSRVKRLTLAYDAARLVTSRWITLPTPEAPEEIHHKDHASPSLHTVEPHDLRVWVNRPKAHEHSLAVREKQDKKGNAYFQYCVKRKRGQKGAYSRGGKGKNPVTPKTSRLVVGVEDLNIPGED